MILGNTQICGILNIAGKSPAKIRSSIQGVLRDLTFECNTLRVSNNMDVNNRIACNNLEAYNNIVVDNDATVKNILKALGITVNDATVKNILTALGITVNDTAAVNKLNVKYGSELGGYIKLKSNSDNVISYGTSDPSSAIRSPMEGQLYFKII